MRTQVRRRFAARLGLIAVLSLVLQTWLPMVDVRAQDSGATTFTVASVSGTVVVKRADGSGETARPGTVLRPGDELASVGRSEVTVNLSSGQSNAPANSGGGATLILFSNTTIGVRSGGDSVGRNQGSGGGGFFVADIASGVVLARTPPTGSSTVQITNEKAGAVAQVNRGGMAVATDVDTGTIAVACDERNAEVAFPYTDMRVPCESNVVRTLSNTNAIDDSRRDDDSPVNAVVHAASQTAVSGTGNQGAGIVAPQAPGGSKEKDKEKEEDSKPQPVASPAPSIHVNGPISLALTWSVNVDLDAHLSGPCVAPCTQGSSRFHVFYNSSPSSVPYAVLNRDACVGSCPGGPSEPEVITISTNPSTGQFVPGEYRYWVFNFSHGGSGSAPTYAGSNAQLTVRQGGSTVATYAVSSASGSPSNDIWHVVNLVLDAAGNLTVNAQQQLLPGSSLTVLCPHDCNPGKDGGR